MQTHEEILQTIKQMPLREQLELIEYILDNMAQRLPEDRPTRRNYDFSDLAGRFMWHGDPIAEQRRLRDEW